MMLCNSFCTILDRMGRPGLWYWVSDIPNRRTGNSIWYFFQLGCGINLLDIKNAGCGVITPGVFTSGLT